MKILTITILLFLASCGANKPRTDKVDQATAIAKHRLSQVATSELDATSFRSLSDSVRRFVNDNSSHDMAKGFTLSPADIAGMANALADYLEQGGEAPVFFCGHRAEMVRVLMEAHGYETRIVNVITSKYTDAVNGHVFMEALNPATGSWEVIDADFDTYYQDLSGNRLSASEVVTTDLDQIVPCNASGCSWGNQSREGIAMDFLVNDEMLGAVLINGEMSLLVNPDRFDANVKYGGKALGELFPEYHVKSI